MQRIVTSILAGLFALSFTGSAFAQDNATDRGPRRAPRLSQAEIDWSGGPGFRGPGGGFGPAFADIDGLETPEGYGLGFGQGFGPGPAGPRPGMGIHRPMPGPHLVRFWDNEELVVELGLTEGQIAQLEASYQTAKEVLQAAAGSLEEAHQALRAALDVDSPDAEAVNAAIDNVTDAHNERMRIVIGHRVVVKNVLTAEQEEALRNFRVERRPGPVSDQDRDRLHIFQGLVRQLAADGELSEEDWALINEKIAGLPEEEQARIRERIQNHMSQGLTPPAGPAGPPADGRLRQGRRALPTQ